MDTSKIKALFNRQMRQTFEHFLSYMSLENAQPNDADKALLALMKWALLTPDGAISQQALNELREMLVKRAGGTGDIAGLMEFIGGVDPLPPSQAAVYFSDTPAEHQLEVTVMLVRLTLTAGNYDEAHRCEIFALAEALGISPERFTEEEHRTVDADLRHKKLVRSGTGLAVALIVLLVFILTATWLRSVIFGLILAYIFLPVEKLIERGVAKKTPFVPNAPHKVKFSTKAVRRIKQLAGNEMPADMDSLPPETRHRNGIIGRATTLTVALATVMLAALLTVVIIFSINYVTGIGVTVRNWVVDNQSTSQTATGASEAVVAVELELEGEEGDFIDDIYEALDDIKVRFQRLPVVNMAVDYIKTTLSDPALFGSFIKRNSGSLLQISIATLTSLATILVDILLTIFFFSLFLRTLAINSDERGRGQNLANYLVRTVFNGRWLPAAGEETLAEGERIIGGAVFRLKTWLRGYLILIAIDTVVYGFFFTLLGVPYPLILGFFAGCTLFLPFIGPVLSVLLTILVTLALGGDSVSGMQIAGILLVYCIQNGIIDQFFLYPAIVGESLGLTTLETIIVVLLGGIFAGITGMIFALPAASIIKYLVPQFYRTIKHHPRMEVLK